MFEDQYLYLWIDFFTIIFPLIFSFLPLKSPFYKNWKAILISIFLPATLFLVWDSTFTHWGIWGFNPRYVLGIFYLKLPVEEFLWFICIPYACIFSYEAVNYYAKKDIIGGKSQIISSVLVCVLLAFGLLNYQKLYTVITFVSLAVFITWIQWFLKPKFIGNFYISFLFLLIPFFIVNGILTGTGIEEPVVWYNNNENLSIRMGTIPIEDTFYGMLLILMNIALYEKFKSRSTIA